MMPVMNPVAHTQADGGLPELGVHEPPLKGVRVLDLSRVLAAPFCAMMLADLGADVTKVEHPKGGDQTRHWGTAIQGGERTYYLAINRTKQSIAIDFAKPEGAELIKALARDSDILVENYLLGTLERYGLGPEVDLLLRQRLWPHGPERTAAWLRLRDPGRKRPDVDHGRARRRGVEGRRTDLRYHGRHVRDPGDPRRVRAHVAQRPRRDDRHRAL